MGLSQGDQRGRLSRVLVAWRLPAASLAVALLLALLGDGARGLLAFHRSAIQDGEIWRLATGHFVHLGFSHLLLNAAGLLLIWHLVSWAFTDRQWLIVAAVNIAAIDLGLWFLEPELTWYVGLSGLLHGLLAAGVVVGMWQARLDAWVLAALLLAKIVYEQIVGPLPGSEDSTGGAVIVAAHAYGAVAGIIAAVALIRVRSSPSI